MLNWVCSLTAGQRIKEIWTPRRGWALPIQHNLDHLWSARQPAPLRSWCSKSTSDELVSCIMSCIKHDFFSIRSTVDTVSMADWAKTTLKNVSSAFSEVQHEYTNFYQTYNSFGGLKFMKIETNKWAKSSNESEYRTSFVLVKSKKSHSNISLMKQLSKKLSGWLLPIWA